MLPSIFVHADAIGVSSSKSHFPFESIKKHNVAMQPVMEKQRTYKTQYSVVKMEEIVVGDIKAIGTCERWGRKKM